MFVSPKPEDIQMTSSCLLLRPVVSAARSCGDVERKEEFASWGLEGSYLKRRLQQL